jgi:hypothetical protein
MILGVFLLWKSGFFGTFWVKKSGFLTLFGIFYYEKVVFLALLGVKRGVFTMKMSINTKDH